MERKSRKTDFIQQMLFSRLSLPSTFKQVASVLHKSHCAELKFFSKYYPSIFFQRLEKRVSSLDTKSAFALTHSAPAIPGRLLGRDQKPGRSITLNF